MAPCSVETMAVFEGVTSYLQQQRTSKDTSNDKQKVQIRTSIGLCSRP